ncbi:MAG: BON domain-containing protein [Candidatus Eremiobacteraeota bacterium]|nr:BON domain-containing protein [Candidatus Eremiobacteraeota bacterium]
MFRRFLALWLCAGFLVATSCSPSQQQQAQTQVNDAFIAAQIRAKISAIDAATVSNVHVKVVNHQVTLSGEVPSSQEHSKIIAAAHSVAGVTKLVDELKINPKAPTAKELESDLSLQARIKTALTEQTGVNAFRIRVSVHKGSVLLEGNVASKTVHSLVLETVRAVPGVRQLTDRVTVGNP